MIIFSQFCQFQLKLTPNSFNFPSLFNSSLFMSRLQLNKYNTVKFNSLSLSSSSASFIPQISISRLIKLRTPYFIWTDCSTSDQYLLSFPPRSSRNYEICYSEYTLMGPINFRRIDFIMGASWLVFMSSSISPVSLSSTTYRANKVFYFRLYMKNGQAPNLLIIFSIEYVGF